MSTVGIIVILSLALLAVFVTVGTVDMIRRRHYMHPPDDGMREDDEDEHS